MTLCPTSYNSIYAIIWLFYCTLDQLTRIRDSVQTLWINQWFALLPILLYISILIIYYTSEGGCSLLKYIGYMPRCSRSWSLNNQGYLFHSPGLIKGLFFIVLAPRITKSVFIIQGARIIKGMVLQAKNIQGYICFFPSLE